MKSISMKVGKIMITFGHCRCKTLNIQQIPLAFLLMIHLLEYKIFWCFPLKDIFVCVFFIAFTNENNVLFLCLNKYLQAHRQNECKLMAQSRKKLSFCLVFSQYMMPHNVAISFCSQSSWKKLKTYQNVFEFSELKVSLNLF